MTTPNFNYFYRVDVTVTDPIAGVTKTYALVNRPVAAASDPQTYWPVLTAVGEVALLAGELLPQSTFSAVELDNTPGTFGASRKFSDVLDRFQVVDQELVLYAGVGATDSDAPGGWVQLAKVRVKDWEATVSGAAGTLTLNVEPFKLRDQVLSLEVSHAVSGMQSAPAGSLGKAVPLLVGHGVDCLPVRISADGATTAEYAWGTCHFGLTRNVSTGYQVYTKDLNDRWAVVRNAAEDTTGLSTFGYVDLNASDRQAYGVQDGGDCLAVGVRLIAKGNGLAASNAVLTAFVLRYELGTLNVVGEVARGSCRLTTYNALNAASTASFPVDVCFDSPAFLSSPDGEYAYAVGWTVSGWQLGDLALHTVTRLSPSLVALFAQDAADSAGGTGNAQGNWKVTAAHPLKLKVLTTAYSTTDHVNAFTDTGLTYSKLTVTQPAPATGQSAPLLEGVPLALGNLQGLSSYPAGTEFSSVVGLVSILSYRWTGAAWVDPGEWDTYTLLSSHYETQYDGGTPAVSARRVRGVFEAKVSFLDVLAELCRSTASRVGIRTTGQLFLYPFGQTVAPVTHVPDADLAPLNWSTQDASTVLNRVVVKSGRTFIQNQQDFEVVNPGEQARFGYEYSNTFDVTAAPLLAARTAYSRALFGRKELLDTQFALRTVNQAGTTNYLTGTPEGEGSVVADFYLSRFGRPLTYATFVVPYHRYNSVELFDIISFASTAYPAFYGTDPDARPPVVDTGSGNVVTVPNANGGQELVRAQTYRGLVEGKSFILPSDHAPAIRLTVLVLLNPYDPT